ncbi:MAG: hypothetical protein NTV88_01845 [Candidatus Micrarchaeota archaeon]|nr:hypothetical protein [Candidatus Micrarchaeota archaeon]
MAKGFMKGGDDDSYTVIIGNTGGSILVSPAIYTYYSAKFSDEESAKKFLESAKDLINELNEKLERGFLDLDKETLATIKEKISDFGGKYEKHESHSKSLKVAVVYNAKTLAEISEKAGEKARKEEGKIEQIPPANPNDKIKLKQL